MVQHFKNIQVSEVNAGRRLICAILLSLVPKRDRYMNSNYLSSGSKLQVYLVLLGKCCLVFLNFGKHFS